MKRFNLPLTIGGAIILFLIIIMIFPHLFTNINPYGTENMRSWDDGEGNFRFEIPPYRPSKVAIFGSDELGRDLFSFIIYGTRLTITLSLLVVLARFLVALPVGLSAGFGSDISKTVIKQFNIVFNAMPALIISIIILQMDFFKSLPKKQSILAFVIVLGFVGWAKLGQIIMERVEGILAQPFIKGEIAIGKKNYQIALSNVIPHLVAELIVLFFMEIARVLTLIMALGIFGVYVGNLRVIQSTDGGIITPKKISFEPEWASMLGTGRKYMKSAPWVVLTPAMAFFISVLGFNLFGEGLRKILQTKDSTFITRVRRLVSFNIKRVQIRKAYKANKKVAVTCIAALLIAALIIGSNINSSFSCINAAHEYPFDFKEQVIIGSDEAEEMAKDIAKFMKDAGLKPLRDEDFTKEYETNKILIPVSSNIKVTIGNEQRELQLNRDYALLSFADIDTSGRIFNTIQEDLFNLEDYEKFDEQFVLIDTKYYSNYVVDRVTEEIFAKSSAKGVIYISKNNDALPSSISSDLSEKPVILISRDLGESLVKNHNSTIDVTVKHEQLANKGRNIIGMISGKDKYIGEEAIIMGFGYNYFEEEIGRKKLYFALEMIRQLTSAEPNRSIIFAFWDGTIKDEYSGKLAYARNTIYPRDKTKLYIDLTELHTTQSKYIHMNSQHCPFSRPFSYGFSQELRERFEEKGTPIKEHTINSIDEMMYYNISIPTLFCSMNQDYEEGKAKVTLDDLGAEIVHVITNYLN